MTNLKDLYFHLYLYLSLLVIPGENILKTGFIFSYLYLFVLYLFVFAFLLVFVFVGQARWDKFEGWLVP